MRTSPCYDCKERVLGCHSKCAAYLDFLAVHEYEMEVIRKAKERSEYGKRYTNKSQRKTHR